MKYNQIQHGIKVNDNKIENHNFTILYNAQSPKLIILGNNIFWHNKFPSKYANSWET